MNRTFSGQDSSDRPTLPGQTSRSLEMLDSRLQRSVSPTRSPAVQWQIQRFSLARHGEHSARGSEGSPTGV